MNANIIALNPTVRKSVFGKGIAQCIIGKSDFVIPECTGFHADHAAVFHGRADIIARERAVLNHRRCRGGKPVAAVAHKIQIMQHYLVRDVGADGQTSLDHGSPAAVAAAIEIHRAGGYVQIAGVGDRRQINIHDGVCRNLLVNAVKERSVPELTDEFVASVSPDDGTVEKYRESTRENLLEQKQLSIDNQRDTDILNAVVDNSEVVCSTASIDEAYDTQLKAYTNMLSSYGVDLATYAGMIGSDEDSFKQEIRQEAKEMAKQSLVLNEIAKQENITIDDSDKEALA